MPQDWDASEVDALPYRLRDDFLSPAEKSFYHILRAWAGEQYSICAKVSLADLFFVARPHENQSAHNRINRKHVDFVVCDPNTMQPLFALELDDRSHARPDRAERDAFVDDVFEAAGLPLIHVPARAGYNTGELAALFQQTLNANAPATPAQPAASGAPPNCPKCDTPMVVRTAKNEGQAGRKFYGCANYPRCRAILPLEVG